MPGNSPTATAVGDKTYYMLGTEERSPDAGEAMRACTFFHTNAATANRMILRMIDFLSGWTKLPRATSVITPAESTQS